MNVALMVRILMEAYGFLGAGTVKASSWYINYE